MSKAVNIYNASGLEIVNAASVNNFSLDIPFENRSYKIESIFIDMDLFNNVSGLRIPEAQRVNQYYRIIIPFNVVSPVSKDFANFTGGILYANTGFTFYNPGKYYFREFYLTNVNQVFIEISNIDPIDSVRVPWSVAVEIMDVKDLT